MMLYRSLVIGMLGALLLLVAQQERAGRSFISVARPPEADATIVDISRDALSSGADLLPALGLAPGERVVAIDDRPIKDTDAVSSSIVYADHGQFVDLEVHRPGATRRVLVLVH